jgi:hypothetical protein
VSDPDPEALCILLRLRPDQTMTETLAEHPQVDLGQRVVGQDDKTLSGIHRQQLPADAKYRLRAVKPASIQGSIAAFCSVHLHSGFLTIDAS